MITLYRQQIKLLTSKLFDKPQIEVLTADKSQGRDKECIVMSLVRSNETGNVGDLLRDWRRLNVCFTRAKSKLVIFGSRSTLANVQLLSEFFGLIDGRGWTYQLPKGADKAPPEVVKRPSSSAPTPKSPKRPRVAVAALAQRSILADVIANTSRSLPVPRASA